jgi:hypothetical protein
MAIRDYMLFHQSSFIPLVIAIFIFITPNAVSSSARTAHPAPELRIMEYLVPSVMQRLVSLVGTL